MNIDTLQPYVSRSNPYLLRSTPAFANFARKQRTLIGQLIIRTFTYLCNENLEYHYATTVITTNISITEKI